MKNLLPPNVRLLGPYILAVIVIIFLGLFTYNFGTTQISSQNQKIKEGKAEKNTLIQKESILSGVQENILPAADLSLAAIPSTNSALAALSQIKALAAENGLAISNINIGSGAVDEKSLRTSAINFDLDGDSGAIINLVSNLTSVAPLMRLDAMTLSSESGITKANLSVKTYWAPLPKTIPGVGDGITSLTDEEVNFLSLFGSLRLPAFSSSAPQEGVVREDPFN